ncbi:MAG: DUF4177 domain-containing protein [Flavobacteriaceae bacterium]|nr:DUF4177 domain-containing protein [Flavobacteriaceae bacterium]
MKEYRVIQPKKLGFRHRYANFEDILNQHAREGWRVVDISQSWTYVVFERDKNR